MAAPSESLATVADVESTPQGVVKRWVSELELARANQEDWEKCSGEIWDLYRSKNRKANSFNILWSNTETLRPALYNSTPRPDVRRRHKQDADPNGKFAANVLERSLVYSLDAYDFDYTIQETVLDVLLPGRGIARVKYEPKFRDVEPETDDGLGLEDEEAPPQEVYDEKAQCRHVEWDSFLHGPGKSWEEVSWIAFRHCLPYEDLRKMFGEEIADKIPLSEPDDGKRGKALGDKTIRTLLKTGEIQEIWDREQKRVLFICERYADKPLRVESDPLGLTDFWPIPRPIYAIEDSSTLVPAPLYEKYKPQAEELNRVTARINKIVDALKVRGAYASNIAEVAKIIEATDNQMLPIENAAAVAALGGLDKAIWLMPVEKLVLVLRELYVSRKETLQTIYEITGLGDIMRGVSNPHETLGAQQLKSQWGTSRLQRLQREVQRFIRDLLRLKAEIMSEHFSMETFMTMTGLALPDDAQKAQAQQAAQQATMQQQPVPAEVQKILTTPTWPQVMDLLKSDQMRQYRIDIETDSTVQETLARDTQDMQNAITSITNLFTQLGPAVQQGYMSVDMLKQLGNAVARNARMGQAVEDVIDQMQQPPPQPAEQSPPDFSREVAQIKAESDQKITAATQAADERAQQADLASKTAIEQAKADSAARVKEAEAISKALTAAAQEQAKREIAELQEQTKRQIAQLQEDGERQREARAQAIEKEISENKAVLDATIKLLVAQINAGAKTAASEGGKSAPASTEGSKSLMTMIEDLIANSQRSNEAMLARLQDLDARTAKPRRVQFELDENGLPSGAIISQE